MNYMINWFARNTVAANLLMVGIIISGFMSYGSMEREVNITVPVNFYQITASWPGAAPQEVEEQIVIRIEEALSDLDNIDRLNSTAQEGFAQIIVESDPKVDTDRFMNEMKRRIDGISTFPRDMLQPRIEQFLTRNEIIRLAVHGNVSEKELTKAAEDVRDKIVLLPGVTIVDLFGAREQEVSIQLSEDAMRRFGVTFDDVASSIRNSSINQSTGRVETQTGDVMLRARSLADSQTEFENIIIKQNSDGSFIKVGDVAQVVDGFEENEILATMNGEPSILVQVMTSETMDVVVTSESVNGWVEENADKLPPGISITVWDDNSKIYFDRMNTIGGAAFSGLILVFFILILTLRPMVALWVTFGIATAFAGAFILLPASDVSLNMLSLFAFLLVLGVVVDDAIVVGENIHTQNSKSGEDSISAAVLGTQLVAKPVVYAVITTMITFAPWLFIEGVASTFTRQISIIVIASLSFSLIEALLILPAHLSKMKPRQNLGAFGRMQKKFAQSIINFAETKYRPFAEWVVSRRYLTTSIFFSFLVFSIGLVSTGWVRTSFMPEVESEMINFNVTLPDGAPYSRALEILTQLQEAEHKLEEEINAEAALRGEEGVLIENWYTRSRRDSVLALVQLAPSEQRQMSAKEAAERLRELIGDIPDAEEVTLQYTLSNDDRDVQFRISANDFDVLRDAVDDLKDYLVTYDGVFDVTDNMQTANEEIRMTLKPGAEQLGLTLGDVSRQVRQAYYGEEVQRLPRDGSDVRVMVKYPREERRSIESLQDFRVRLNDGREVPLLAVADLEYAPSLKRIDRRERMRSAVVSADLSEDFVGDIFEDLNENFWDGFDERHPDVTRGAIGSAQGQQQFMDDIQALYMVALFAMYAVIAIAFHSYWLPLLIMVAIPFAFMGSVFGHGFFGSSISLFSYFGIGAAAGVVVNDNLVLVDFMNKLRDKGVDAYAAVVEAGVARFRPIMLTSVTTFVGLIPMMADRSTQAAFLQPTVIGLAFGVLFATFVTLALVPALYGVGEDANKFFGRAKARFKQIASRGKSSPAVQPGE